MASRKDMTGGGMMLIQGNKAYPVDLQKKMG
jgi:hypothetical protein